MKYEGFRPSKYGLQPLKRKVVGFPRMILVMLGERSRYSDTLIFSKKNKPYAIVVLWCGICLRVSKALTTNRMGSLQKQFSKNQGVIGRFDPSLYITLGFSLWCSRVWQGCFFWGEGCQTSMNFSHGFRSMTPISIFDLCWYQTWKPNPPICSRFSWPHDSQKFTEGAVKTIIIAYNPIFHMQFVENSATMVPPQFLPCSQRKCIKWPQEVILSLPHAAVVFPPSLSTHMTGLRTALCRKDATHPGHAFGRGLVGMPRLATLLGRWGSTLSDLVTANRFPICLGFSTPAHVFKICFFF